MKPWILLSLLLVPTVSAVGADFYVMDVSPKELSPGETGILNITLKNLGSDFAAYLRATLDPQDVSPIDAIDSAKKYLSRAEAAKESEEYFGIVRQREELNLQYRIKVDDNAALGAYSVPLMLVWEDELRKENTQTVYLGITVKGEPDLIIAGINTTPSRIYSDSEFTLTLKLENIGKAKARSVETKLVLPEEISGEHTAFLGTIERDGTSTAAYDLKVAKQAPSKAYELALLLSYIDMEGAQRQVEKPFELYVSQRGEVNLEIAGVSTSPSKIYPGDDFTLSVQLENIGTQDAKSVKAELLPLEEFVGEYSSFIGKIEEDDVSSGIFDMRVAKKAKPGSYDFVMKVTYTDVMGTEFVEEKHFSIFVDRAPRKYSRYLAALGVVILLLAVYLWRRRVEV